MGKIMMPIGFDIIKKTDTNVNNDTTTQKSCEEILTESINLMESRVHYLEEHNPPKNEAEKRALEIMKNSILEDKEFLRKWKNLKK